MQKILVTGGLGFIASNLIEKLLKKYYVINVDKVGYASIHFYNTKDYKHKKNYKFIKLNIQIKKNFKNFYLNLNLCVFLI